MFRMRGAIPAPSRPNMDRKRRTARPSIIRAQDKPLIPPSGLLLASAMRREHRAAALVDADRRLRAAVFDAGRAAETLACGLADAENRLSGKRFVSRPHLAIALALASGAAASAGILEPGDALQGLQAADRLHDPARTAASGSAHRSLRPMAATRLDIVGWSAASQAQQQHQRGRQ